MGRHGGGMGSAWSAMGGWIIRLNMNLNHEPPVASAHIRKKPPFRP